MLSQWLRGRHEQADRQMNQGIPPANCMQFLSLFAIYNLEILQRYVQILLEPLLVGRDHCPVIPAQRSSKLEAMPMGFSARRSSKLTEARTTGFACSCLRRR